MESKNIIKTVYFIRHGQSEANVSSVFQAPDSPLTETGKQQAGLIAERVAKLSFETLISSPFTRAKETAEAIGKMTNKTPEYSNLFVERLKPSRINGKPHEDNEAKELWNAWEESLYASGIRVEDGENFDDLIKRADEALGFLKNRPEKELVVVTHGFFLRTIIGRVLLDKSLTAENFRNLQSRAASENAGISVVNYYKGWEDDRWRLWTYNDHAHLG